jgi:transaldolase
MKSPDVAQLKIKIFADGADLKSIKDAATNPLIKGFTTNPTLMRSAGVTDYKAFALDVLKAHSRAAGLVRSLRRRFSDHGRPGAGNRVVG